MKITWNTFVDLLLVTFVLFQVISLLRGTRTIQVLWGMTFIFAAYLLSEYWEFNTLHWLIGQFYSSFIIFIIVIFQDDIRYLLTHFGRQYFSKSPSSNFESTLDEVSKACQNLSQRRQGALIIFERAVGLKHLYNNGITLNASISEPLLISLFQNSSPLHDGAVILHKNRIIAAAAQLPLSKNNQINSEFGMRHRAALGLSEESDALAIVVSEQTGKISLVQNGQLSTYNNEENFKEKLENLLKKRFTKKKKFLKLQSLLQGPGFRLSLTSFISAVIISFMVTNHNHERITHTATIHIATNDKFLVIGGSEKKVNVELGVDVPLQHNLNILGIVDATMENRGKVKVRLSANNFPAWRTFKPTVPDPWLEFELDTKESKKVPVKAIFQGTPKEGVFIKKVIVRPKEIWVNGASRELENIQWISTEAIPLDDIDEHFSTLTRLSLHNHPSISVKDDKIFVKVLLGL